MERNLLRQHQRRRELRGGRESSGGIHIHIQDTTDSVRGRLEIRAGLGVYIMFTVYHCK